MTFGKSSRPLLDLSFLYVYKRGQWNLPFFSSLSKMLSMSLMLFTVMIYHLGNALIGRADCSSPKGRRSRDFWMLRIWGDGMQAPGKGEEGRVSCIFCWKKRQSFYWLSSPWAMGALTSLSFPSFLFRLACWGCGSLRLKRKNTSCMYLTW